MRTTKLQPLALPFLRGDLEPLKDREQAPLPLLILKVLQEYAKTLVLKALCMHSSESRHKLCLAGKLPALSG